MVRSCFIKNAPRFASLGAALVNIHMGNDEDAIDDLNNALKRDSKDKVARGARAMVLRRMGDYKKCQLDYTNLAKRRDTERMDRFDRAEPITGMTPLAPKSAGRMRSVHGGFDPVRLVLLGGETLDNETKMKMKMGKKRPKSAPSGRPAGPEETMLLVSDDDDDDGDDEERIENENSDPDPHCDSDSNSSSSNNRYAKPHHLMHIYAENAPTPLFNTTKRSDRSALKRTVTVSLKTKEEMAANAPDLKSYKAAMGENEDVFDGLFSKPTDLQVAFCKPPGKRSQLDTSIIVGFLKEFKTCNELSPTHIQSLAGVIEYRTVAANHDCFVQGEKSDAMCFIKSGSVRVKMTNDKGEVVNVCDIGPGEHFGEQTLLLNGAIGGRTKLFSSEVNPPKREGEEVEDNNIAESEKKLERRTALIMTRGGADSNNNDNDNDHEGVKRFRAVPLRETYFCTENCELLLVLQQDFNKYMRKVCNDLQREKFQILKRSRIFKGWSTDAMIRLARLGRMKVIPRNTRVVEQNKQVENLYFLQKGIAKVFKYPDRCAQLVREKTLLLNELNLNRQMYSYHRCLKGSMQKQEKMDLPGLGMGMLARGVEKIQGGEGVFISPEQIVSAEVKQESLERKIRVNDRMLAKFKKEEENLRKSKAEERKQERKRKRKLGRIMNGGGPGGGTRMTAAAKRRTRTLQKTCI